MNRTSRHLIHRIIADFAPRHTERPRILIPGKKSHRKTLANLGVSQWTVAMPDAVIHDLERDWLFLMDASPRQRHMTELRRAMLNEHFAPSGRHLVFFSAFPDHRSFCRCIESIAWESHVWIADAPDHMIHFNGERFLGPYLRFQAQYLRRIRVPDPASISPKLADTLRQAFDTQDFELATRAAMEVYQIDEIPQ